MEEQKNDTQVLQEKQLVVDYEKKSMSLEFYPSEMDILIFRLNRAKIPFKEYKHRSTKLNKAMEIIEEIDARMIILTDFKAFRVLNLFDNDLMNLVLDHNIMEACIYENIIEDDSNHWSENLLTFQFQKFFKNITDWIKQLKLNRINALAN